MQSPAPPNDATGAADAGAARRVAAALSAGAVVLAGLAWLLARLVWLWYLFGMFFFLLAGLLAGAAMFPILRPSRPMRGRRVATVAAAAALCGAAAEVAWEYRYIAGSAGDVPHFAAARNALVAAGRSPDEVFDHARTAFETHLADRFRPGGVLGYVRWAIHEGRSELSIGDLGLNRGEFVDVVAIAHRGVVWPLRAAGCTFLLFVGLWWQLSGLRSATPLSNLIDPHEADELEREELREAGEPGWITFDHTADVGLEARGRSLAELYEQAALGLMGCIGDLVPDASDRGETVRIALAAPTVEELLHDWLSELLVHFETRQAVARRFKLRSATEQSLAADVHFVRFDPQKSQLQREVKAVTYHDLTVTRQKKLWTSRVILDI